jgi:hypothetical protein
MDKKIPAAVGTVAALAVCGSAIAAPPAPRTNLAAQSYAKLLEPVANAAALLKADDATRASASSVQLARYHHHHHHHHHGYFYRYRRYYYHHHHHHHHRYYRWYR